MQIYIYICTYAYLYTYIYWVNLVSVAGHDPFARRLLPAARRARVSHDGARDTAPLRAH